MSVSKNNMNEVEINFLALYKKIWNNRLFLFIVIVVSILFGLFIALIIPNQYTATSTFIPQTNESVKPGGSLSGLVSLAGINLNGINSGSDIPPSLYPKIVSSVPFKKSLLEATFRVNGISSPVSYKDYYNYYYDSGILDVIKKYTLGLPSILLNTIREKKNHSNIIEDNKIISISLEEFEHFQRLDNQISIVPNVKEGFVTLSFSMPEASIAAEMAKYAEDLLQKEIINFKVQNAKEQLSFTEERFKEKKKDFEKIQNKLATFRDSNQNLTSSSVINQLQKLEAEYNFEFTIYNEISKQLEQAKLQVSKDTPVLTVIQPVTVPIEKESPNRGLIILLFLIIGFLAGVIFIIFNDIWYDLRQRWESI